jgi:hypothetical protein
MSILDKYLKKLGASNYSDLNTEERKTFKGWESALAGRRITDDDVRVFLKEELDDTLNKLPKQRLGSNDDTFLKMKLEFIRSVQTFLNMPDIEKQLVESSIETLLDS